VRLEDLDYDLPPELIAQHPSPRREAARMLVLERDSGRLHDASVADLPQWLRHGDMLVVNETRVRPARLWLRRVPSGGRIEVLFVRPASAPQEWRVLARPARRAAIGTRLESAAVDFAIEVIAIGEEGERIVRVIHGDLLDVLARAGELPLPPYITHSPTAEDRERYQTVYARVEGAVAAPTAGLHLSWPLLERLAAGGITIARLVLHVGPGTFRPIAALDPRDHRMDEEFFEVPEDVAVAARATRESGGRIVAVGTTVVRALEAAADAHGGSLGAASGWTRKFIHPPYAFQAVDVLLTNFHLPRTSLLLLVAAFAGEELQRGAYRHAIAERYRFYSYGDAMLVI
jgi:S-adenosylmethionine:tRNA ribosyltransferase-isomerase